MAKSRLERRFDRAEAMSEDQLTGAGKKNAKHAEDVHNELELTRAVIAAFLDKRLPEMRPDDWEDACIEAALNDFAAVNASILLPTPS